MYLSELLRQERYFVLLPRFFEKALMVQFSQNRNDSKGTEITHVHKMKSQ